MYGIKHWYTHILRGIQGTMNVGRSDEGLPEGWTRHTAPTGEYLEFWKGC